MRTHRNWLIGTDTFSFNINSVILLTYFTIPQCSILDTVLFVQHLHNLWQCYYEDSVSAAANVAALYQALASELEERACSSEKLIYSYYDSISSHKVNSVVCGLVVYWFEVSCIYLRF